MERKDAGVNTEESVPAQDFDVPIFEVEGVMGGYSSGVGGMLVIRGIRNREIGEGGNADGRRVGYGRRRNCFGLWYDNRFWYRVLKDLRFETCAG
jgi:hypothetical protein